MYVEATETTGDQTTVRKLEAESSDPLVTAFLSDVWSGHKHRSRGGDKGTFALAPNIGSNNFRAVRRHPVDVLWHCVYTVGTETRKL